MLGIDPAAARGDLLDVLVPETLAAAGVGARLRPVDADRRRPAVPAALRHRALLRCRRVPATARRRPPRRGRVRRRVRGGRQHPGGGLAAPRAPRRSGPRAAGLAGVARRAPRDNGAGWDFEDVRDHYLATLFGVDPAALRATDPARYAELSRHVGGELLRAVFGEWRRGASPSRGGLVWWLNDLRMGAGFGLVDADARPKAPYWAFARLLAPVAVWLTDEGTNGVDVHVANDTGRDDRRRPRRAPLRPRRGAGRRGRAPDPRPGALDGPRRRRGAPRPLRRRRVRLSLRPARARRRRRRPDGGRPRRPRRPLPARTAGRSAAAAGEAVAATVAPRRGTGRRRPGGRRGAWSTGSASRRRATRPRPTTSCWSRAASPSFELDPDGSAGWTGGTVGATNLEGVAPIVGADRLTATITPLWFGSAEAPIAGRLHAPATPARDLSVVVCGPPFGWEDVCAYRSLRALAIDARERGLHHAALRLPRHR